MNKAMRKINHVFNILLRHEQWCIGIIHAPIESFLENKEAYSIKWFDHLNRNQFTADPFSLLINGKMTVFYEHFDYWNFKGKIMSAEYRDGKLENHKKNILNLHVHASFPFVFKDAENVYCIAETQAINEIVLYQKQKNSDQWGKVCTIVEDFAGVDPAVVYYKNKWWLFCTNENDGKNEKLHIWYAEKPEGPWRKHRKNPVKIDIQSARSGGTPFVHNGELYRPAQDCSKTYGGKITINKVIKLTEDEFEEEVCSTVGPFRDEKFSDGFHTLSQAADYTVIDGKRYIFSISALISKTKLFIFKKIFKRKKYENIFSRSKVLILGEDTRSFLGVIRSLGRKGIEVHVAWCPNDSLALYSKYIKKNHYLPQFSQLDNSWINSLIELLKTEQFDLVIACNDQTLIPLQKHRSELEKYSKIYTLSDKAFEVAFSKTKSYALAKSLNIHVSPSKVISHIEGIEEIINNFSFPLIMKPDSSFLESDLLSRNNVRTIKNENELKGHAKYLLKNGPILIQQFFVGEGVGVELIAKDGEILAAFQHERVREPQKGGGSSYRKSVAVKPSLFEASRKIIKALDYTGVAMIEFRINKNNDWIFVEINGRFWGSLPLAIAAGIDFPWYLYQMLVQGKINFSQKYTTELYSRNLWLDVAWIREKISLFGFFGFMKEDFMRIFKELFRIFIFKEKNDTFVVDDILPGIMEVFKMIKLASNAAIDKIVLIAISNKILRSLYATKIQNRFKEAKSVLFVCKGNICRSPFAEEYAKTVFPDLKISSVGYYPIENRPPVMEAVSTASQFDVDLSGHYSRILSSADVDSFDIIFIFDSENYSTLAVKFPHSRKKMYFLGAISENDSLNIGDPFGKSDEKFTEIFRLIAKNIKLLRE